MPIYEYKCQNCDYRFEQLQKMTDKPLQACPKCGKRKLVKLVSNTSFQLKGSGWYATDFKNKKTEKLDEPTKEEKTKSVDAKDQKKDTKPKDKEKAKAKNTESK